MTDEMSRDGRELIFLISQPRSGSTLLQHILGAHPDIHTLPEPWLMLPLVFARKPEGVTASYNAGLARMALDEFLSCVDEGEQAYAEGVRDLARRVYGQALHRSGKRFFVDKTPRYYLIIPELAELFPQARFILLFRNPLAVLSSMVETQLGGNVIRLFEEDRLDDLLSAPVRLLEGRRLLGPRAVSVSYERLVEDPHGTIAGLCEFLGVPFREDMIEYGPRVQFERARFVDPKSIYRHSRPSPKYADRWRDRFDTKEKVRAGRAYVKALGPETIEDLGYSHDVLSASLKDPSSWSLLPPIPWSLATRHGRLRWWERSWLSVTCSLHQLRRYTATRGVAWTLAKALSRLVPAGDTDRDE